MQVVLLYEVLGNKAAGKMNQNDNCSCGVCLYGMPIEVRAR